MRTSIMISAAGIALAVAASVLPPLRGHEAAAQPASQSAPQATPPATSAPTAPAPATPAPAAPAQQPGAGLYISAVDLDIVPSSMIRFTAALQDDGAAMIKEPGAREFDSTVAEKEASHVFIFEVYNSSAAYDSHQKTLAYTKFLALTMSSITKYNIRAFTAVSMNANTAAAPASGSLLAVKEELDIVPAQIAAFMAAAESHAAASVQDGGCREFDITVLGSDANHVMLFEVYDNAAALTAHRATDHFKAYETATKDMVAQRQGSQLTSLQMLVKAQ
jgi:(4S)-4-hydroxy-5-phosphonooxypentane-2,3-dione isomerase